MRKDLDLKRLFDSKLCTQVITRDLFAHFDTFPEFHKNGKTRSGTFTGDWVELSHN